MNTAFAHSRGQARQHLLFLLLSILLHVALLFGILPPEHHFPLVRKNPVKIYLATLPASERARILDRHSAKQRSHTSVLTAPDDLPPAAAPRVSSQPLIESALSIARDEGRKAEQDIAATEKRKLNTPAGALDQYMRMPHKEIHLANGVTKIITDLGTVCFQPVPYFARDSAGLFGIPATCP